MTRRGGRALTPINEISGLVGRILDVAGIVMDFSFHRKSEGSDFVCVLTIVDHTQQSPELTVNVFTSRLEHLPVIKSRGDVIVLHDVKIMDYRGEVNAVFKKEKSSFGLFDVSLSCYQALNEFSVSSTEMQYLSNLKNWWQSVRIHLGSNAYLTSIGDLSKNAYFDLVCKVLHISYDVLRGAWILFVWDGTDAPLSSLNGKINDELPLHFESIPLERSIMYKYKRIGTLLRVMADKKHENLDKQFLGVGKWVKIRSMVAEVSSGIWYATLINNARVRLLDDDDNNVVECKRKFSERISNHGRVPLWGNFGRDLTVIEYDEMESVQFVTLGDVIVCKEDNVSFFCVVRVIAINPLPALNGFETSYRLTLEDPTARINALLCKTEELMTFFNGFHGDNLVAKMKELLGVPRHQNVDDDNGTRSPPLVKFCFEPCIDAFGNKSYQIIRTKLIQ